MYLKEIKVQGFKSFADKLSIELTNGITGIVGPNGSGKSNVVDAVRWVLGEQSVKSLRGDNSMTDVIFSGSKSRKQTNVAYVTLIFDNSDKYLNIEADLVSVKRMVYRDGTNEYYINNESARLKDITNLFLDTGVAKESFNIISQGKIEEIISYKPSERRIIFEEAAGVLKYKKRKEEALRKLDKTNANMERINDIIEELKNQIEPLKIQSEKANIYNSSKFELKEKEISLIITDITNINNEYQIVKENIDIINKKLESIDHSSNTSNAHVIDMKNNLNKLNIEIDIISKELLRLTVLIEQINGQKKIILERQKYLVEETKLHNNLVNLASDELELKTNINKLNLDNETISKDIKVLDGDILKLNEQLKIEKDLRLSTETNLNKLFREKNNLENQIETLKYSIESNGSLPYAVKSILSNIKLTGIKNTIGNVIEVDESYSQAISTTLGGVANYVITDNESVSKEAIMYLKNNNLGRATFFPLSVIKPRYIDEYSISKISNQEGFINVASNLVKYDKVYDNVIKNQLGNVIIVNNIDNANKISRVINNQYKIVTLAGDVVHVGGSLTGGSSLKVKNIISEKYELENNIKNLKNTEIKIKNLEEEINKIDYNCKSIEDIHYIKNKELITLKTSFDSNNSLISSYTDKLNTVTSELNSIEKTNDITVEEKNILEQLYKTINEKNELENKLNSFIKNRTDIDDEINNFESMLKKNNQEFYVLNKELKDLEIKNNRYDVKLDNLLNILNESYNITYERAVKEYALVDQEDKVRLEVNNLKNIINSLGPVNLTAPEEYEKVKERYDFLINQQKDLLEAEKTLLSIINELDSVMSSEFLKTFNLIKDNFNATFKELFKGGSADLKLTDKDNILETGIEIIATPPGKKLNSISLLSGGEKTFTAISLLFAILKSRPVPFCILDEVEAALDEVNVVNFGEFLKSFENKTQFILITHKKKTMEFVDVLYGITMQESGVSKLVSVKLADIE